MSTRTIEISEETYDKIKDQLPQEDIDNIIDVSDLSAFIGKKVFMRTVTNYLIGEVKSQIGKFWVLKKASWVQDTKRFMNFIKDGVVDDGPEIEPVGEVMVNIDSVVDMYVWKHGLPTKQQ